LSNVGVNSLLIMKLSQIFVNQHFKRGVSAVTATAVVSFSFAGVPVHFVFLCGRHTGEAQLRLPKENE